MVQHIWSVLCSNCVIDRISNTISLIEAIEELRAEGVPPEAGVQGIIPLQCSLVSNWERLPADRPTRATVKIRKIRPTGELEREQEYVVDLATTPRCRTIARINGIGFREAGRHVFEIHVKEDGAADWTQVASIPVIISVVPLPAQAGANQP